MIGRNAARSNLVITSEEISSAHAVVWRDPTGSCVWIEDLNSTNGTFYRKATSSGSSGWIRLSGTIQLTPGDAFQLSEHDKAVFEIKQNE